MPKEMTEKMKLKQRAHTHSPWQHVRWWIPREYNGYKYWGHCVVRYFFDSSGNMSESPSSIMTIEEFTEAKLKLGRDP